MNTKVVALVAIALGVALVFYFLRSQESLSPIAERLVVPASDASDVATPSNLPTERTANAESNGGLESSQPTEPRPQNDEQDTGTPLEKLAAVASDVDPSFSGRNFIMSSQGSEREIGFDALELKFRAEHADPSWSTPTEARILDQISHVTGLGLVSFEAACRETVCRLKLFHPPGTNAVASLDKLRPIAKQIGLDHAGGVATMGDDGVPISLLYFLRDAADTPGASK